MNITKILSILSVMMFHPLAFSSSPILADAELLKELKIQVIELDTELGVGFARVSENDKAKISRLAHEKGRCGGYQLIDEIETKSLFAPFAKSLTREKNYLNFKNNSVQSLKITSFNQKISDALKDVSDSKIGEWVTWLSGFGGRFHASSTPNRHTEALAEQLRQIVAGVGYPTTVSLIEHKKTMQKSVRLRLEGSVRPQETVVLGGHLDSVNWEYFGDKNNAPGADDNASGSAALLEALRVLLKQGQPERSIEFMFYAGEEVGLYGSTDLAKDYKLTKRDVVAVLQLDMVLSPGSGENTISSISDFTSGWLRDLLLEWNSHYLNVKIIDDKCGYACSDHAAWFQQGYPTLMPFESQVKTMNGNIHTPGDTLSHLSSLKHAAIFAKIAVIFGMDLANSTKRAQVSM